MKIKVLHHEASDEKKRSGDINRIVRNPDPQLHPFERAREYKRALNAVKIEKIFAKPLVAAMGGHTDAVKCMARSHKRLTDLFTGSCDGEIRYWNLSTKECDRAIKAHDGFVRGICTSFDDRYVFSVGDDKVIKQWSIEKNFKIDALDMEAVEDTGNLTEGGNATALEVEVTPYNSFNSQSALTSIDHHWTRPLLVATGETVDIWDHHRSAPVQTFEWGCDMVISARFNPAEPCLIAATAADDTVGLYDLRGSAPIRKLLLKMRSNAVCWNPMEPFHFTVANEDHNLYTFDMRKLQQAVNVHKDFTSAVLDVDYSPSGREFVAASYDQTVRIFNTMEPRSRDVYHTKRMQRVLCCKFSPDARYVISGSEDANVRVWKAQAAMPVGPRSFRERKAIAYREALKNKYGHLKEVQRIKRHHHVPVLVKKTQERKRVMRQALQRKEANVIAHSRPGSVQKEAEKKKAIVKEIS